MVEDKNMKVFLNRIEIGSAGSNVESGTMSRAINHKPGSMPIQADF
jgi:hypothetical protein